MGHFLLFYPHNSPKNQNFEKMRKQLEISPFYICVPKIMIRWCTVPEKWCVTDIIVFLILGYQNFEKNKKSTRGYHFASVYQKLWSDGVWFLRYGVRQMDGQTNRQTDSQKKWHLEVPHLKRKPLAICDLCENLKVSVHRLCDCQNILSCISTNFSTTP